MTLNNGHHQTMIQLLTHTLKIDTHTMILLDIMRKQRNVADYSGDIIPESTMKDCIYQAEQLLKRFNDFLAQKVIYPSMSASE